MKDMLKFEILLIVSNSEWAWSHFRLCLNPLLWDLPKKNCTLIAYEADICYMWELFLCHSISNQATWFISQSCCVNCKMILRKENPSHRNIKIEMLNITLYKIHLYLKLLSNRSIDVKRFSFERMSIFCWWLLINSPTVKLIWDSWRNFIRKSKYCIFYMNSFIKSFFTRIL